MIDYLSYVRQSENWEDYELIDTSSGERLERWKDIILIRPDPQIVWKTEKGSMWEEAHARYHRLSSGGGYWERYRDVPDVWTIKYKDLLFNVKPMGFKHMGIFPEQAVNWDLLRNIIKGKKKDKFSVLNLFAYTGGATLACAKEGASVCHVDASKGMVTWAKENAKISGLADANVRYIVDDCMKFVARESRRGNLYDGIIMDPPSYGRGPNKEVWKLEEKLYDFLIMCDKILKKDASFLVLNSYTTGLSPTIMGHMLEIVFKKRGGKVISSEIGLPMNGGILPSGNTSIWLGEENE